MQFHPEYLTMYEFFESARLEAYQSLFQYWEQFLESRDSTHIQSVNPQLAQVFEQKTEDEALRYMNNEAVASAVIQLVIRERFWVEHMIQQHLNQSHKSPE